MFCLLIKNNFEEISNSDKKIEQTLNNEYLSSQNNNNNINKAEEEIDLNNNIQETNNEEINEIISKNKPDNIDLKDSSSEKVNPNNENNTEIENNLDNNITEQFIENNVIENSKFTEMVNNYEQKIKELISVKENLEGRLTELEKEVILYKKNLDKNNNVINCLLDENANLVENANLNQSQESLKSSNPNINSANNSAQNKSYVISEIDKDLLDSSAMELSTLRHDLAVVNLELREKNLEIEQAGILKQQISDLKKQLETEIDRNQKIEDNYSNNLYQFQEKSNAKVVQLVEEIETYQNQLKNIKLKLQQKQEIESLKQESMY